LNISTYLHGIYPRSEAVVAATRDLDRGRTTSEAVDDLYDQDLKELVQAQEEAGVDHFTDGLLRWQDLFRPILEACPGLKPGALVRWFDNNTFYRQPEVTGELSLETPSLPILESSGDVPRPRVATLPSPYLFSRVALAKSDPNELMQDFAAGILKPLARRLAADGYSIIQLQEPWVAFHGIEDDDWKPFAESLGVVTDGLEATTVLHTYYGDASPWIDRLRELPVDAVGFDIIHTDLDALGTEWSTGILVGCLDGRNSLIEAVEHVVDFVRRVADRLEPPAIHLSVSSDLELLPQATARQKVLAMGEAGRRLKETL
jgi:5-methyltetrahydropteroyltriglutamate--homocysteine methyltransferase